VIHRYREHDRVGGLEFGDQLVGQGGGGPLAAGVLIGWHAHGGEGRAVEMRHGLGRQRPLDDRTMRIALEEVARETQRLGVLAEQAGMDEKDSAHDGLRVVMDGRVDGAKMVGTPFLNKPEQSERALWLSRIIPGFRLFGKATEHINTIPRYRSALPSPSLSALFDVTSA